MSDSNSKQILSQLTDENFGGRDRETAKISAIARSGPSQHTTTDILLLGAPRTGKTEILRKSFDRLFWEGKEVLPFYYSLQDSCLDPVVFARDYFSQCLIQFAAFRRNDPSLIKAGTPSLSIINGAAPAGDYVCVRSMVDAFSQALRNDDVQALLRLALSAPATAAAHAGLKPLMMIDNWHLVFGTELLPAFLRDLKRTREHRLVTYVLTGVRRLLKQLLPADPEIFDRIEVIQIERLSDESLEKLIRSRADLLGVETTDSTIELIIQQLNRDAFYIRAILNAAGSRGLSLRTFIEFERLYTDEVLNGRIGQYFETALRAITDDSSERRGMLEALALTIEAGQPVPLDAVSERLKRQTSRAEELLARLHSAEIVDISYGFIAAAPDPVFADFVQTKYRREIVGAPQPLAGEELLGEKLKQSYRLMMSRYNRATEVQLVELLSRFDSQNVPASPFNTVSFDSHYRGVSRANVRRALDEEAERVRLPQIVLVHDLGEGEQPGVTWRLFAATGFEGGIYTESNEVCWLVALINSKEPLDVETLGRIDQRLESALRGQIANVGISSHTIRWYISKEGFSAVASERLASLHSYCSTYSHLDLIQDYFTRLVLGGETKPSSVFELVIPIEEEAELIAARTAEQIARAAEFDQESVNQIKTALIEACINAAEHSDSPDKKIRQHFAIDDDKLIITVSNKGKRFGGANGSNPPVGAQPSKGARGRGLQIIRALMDEVEFEETDDGARLVMTKYLKRPSNQ